MEILIVRDAAGPVMWKLNNAAREGRIAPKLDFQPRRVADSATIVVSLLSMRVRDDAKRGRRDVFGAIDHCRQVSGV